MVGNAQVIQSLGKCVRELETVREMIAVLYNAGYIDEKTVEILKDRGILFSEESPAIKEARLVLQQAGSIKNTDAVFCSNCNTIVDIYGDEKLEVVENIVWLFSGCPYCRHNKLEIIPNAKD
jgi:hypothetical protein